MEVEFDVKVTSGALYDYMMYHTFTGFQGIIGTLCGIFLIMIFFMGQPFWYLIAGIVVIGYLPITLFLKSKQQYLMTPAFKEPLHYVLNDEGVTISQGETTESQTWENMVKAVSTPGSIILYTSKVNASIFPKKDLGDKKAAVVQIISVHMEPKKVKIRGN